jgi:tetratricopeptide (TPR) repeat protein
MDGRLDEAIALIRQISTRGEELGIPEYARIVETQVGANHLLLGNKEDTQRMLPRVQTSLWSVTLYVASLGQNIEVSKYLDSLVIARPGFGSPDDQVTTWLDMVLLKVATQVGHRVAVEMLMGKLANTKIRLIAIPIVSCAFAILGAGAAMLGRYDEARHYYAEAIRVCTEIRFRPELALSRLQLAELLLEHYPQEKKDALEHLDFAIKEFREMKMQPSLERALRHKDILKV